MRSSTWARRRAALALFAALTFVAAGVFVPGAGRAQSAAVPAVLAGTWIHDGDPARAIRTVDAAFAASISVLPELLQGFARDRIRSDMQPPRRVLVVLESSRVRVTLEADRATVIDGAMGSPARTSGVADGTRVTPRLSSGWLELFYEGEGSELRQLLSTEPDGSHMHLDFNVVSARLRSPVRYRLEYVRPPS